MAGVVVIDVVQIMLDSHQEDIIVCSPEDDRPLGVVSIGDIFDLICQVHQSNIFRPAEKH